MKMLFPYDKRNPAFDGLIHDIDPVELSSISINGHPFWVMGYEENGQYGITLLANRDGNFIKVPLDDYDCLESYLQNNDVQEESLDALRSQIFIDTMGIQNARSLFQSGLIQVDGLQSPLNPPGPPFNINVPEPEGPRARVAFASPPQSPPIPPDQPEQPEFTPGDKEYEKERDLYVGVYDSSFAVYRPLREGTNKSSHDIDKYVFGREPEKEILTRKIETYLYARSAGIELGSMHVDYGRKGVPEFYMTYDLRHMIEDVGVENDDKIVGRVNYRICIADFADADDFEKFRHSSMVSCHLSENMTFEDSRRARGEIFRQLAEGTVPATFQDSYGRRKENSFAQQINDTHKKR